jgi:hypothetical protein
MSRLHSSTDGAIRARGCRARRLFRERIPSREAVGAVFFSIENHICTQDFPNLVQVFQTLGQDSEMPVETTQDLWDPPPPIRVCLFSRRVPSFPIADILYRRYIIHSPLPAETRAPKPSQSERSPGLPGGGATETLPPAAEGGGPSGRGRSARLPLPLQWHHGAGEHSVWLM